MNGELRRYTSERCGDCGRGLTWIEISFGRFNDPICGACLIKRNAAKEEQTIDLDDPQIVPPGWASL